MLWVWVLPLAVLCFALIAFNPEWTSVLARPSTVGSRLSHYFGWGCQPRAHCLDQLVITMPFYSSVAYSLGALLARNALKKPRQVPSVSCSILFHTDSPLHAKSWLTRLPET